MFNSNFTIFTRSFDTTGGYPATYNLVAGTRYALGVIQVGTTVATLAVSNYQTGSANLLPRIVGQKTGQTDLANNTGSVAASIVAPWGRFS